MAITNFDTTNQTFRQLMGNGLMYQVPQFQHDYSGDEEQYETILSCLADNYGLELGRLTFLPLGADSHTAVYRADATDSHHYFVKLRRGKFNEASLTIPNFLSNEELRQLIPALTTQNGQLWANLSPFTVALYPFVSGRNAFELRLNEWQWFEFGLALKKLHTTTLPTKLTKGVRRENFSAQWRNRLTFFLEGLAVENFAEPVAAELAHFLKDKKRETAEIIQRSEQLAQLLQAALPPFVLCHADIHGWNLLIDEQGALHLVDWDTLIFAPKERDLMFIGGGLAGVGYKPEEEEALFYRGYGQAEINDAAIAYYRYERVIEDIALYCEQIFLSDDGGEDRRQAVKYVQSNYEPNGTIAAAGRTAPTLL